MIAMKPEISATHDIKVFLHSVLRIFPSLRIQAAWEAKLLPHGGSAISSQGPHPTMTRGTRGMSTLAPQGSSRK